MNKTLSKLYRSPYRILFIPVALAMASDFFVTFIGQSAGFWDAPSASINELSPIGIWLLGFHSPAIFVLLNLIYIFLVYAAFIYAPSPFNFMIAAGFLLGHFDGASSWITYDTQNIFSKLGLPYDVSSYGWWLGVAFSILFGVITGICIHMFLRRRDIRRSS